MKKIIQSFAFIIILHACSNDSNKEQQIKANEDKPFIESVVKDSVVEVEKIPTTLIEQIAFSQEKCINKLEKSYKNEANKLYKELKVKMDSFTEVLNNKHSSILENYAMLVYDDFGNQKPKSSKVIKIEKELASINFEFWDVGEGMAEIRPKANFYFQLFNKKVTEDLNDFLKYNAEDLSKLYVADAGLVISWEELGDRVIKWEKFCAKYTKSEYLKEGIDHYKEYLYYYVCGLDNTPNKDWETKELYPENKAEYERFIKENPKSKTNKYITYVLKNEKTEDELWKMIEAIK